MNGLHTGASERANLTLEQRLARLSPVQRALLDQQPQDEPVSGHNCQPSAGLYRRCRRSGRGVSSHVMRSRGTQEETVVHPGEWDCRLRINEQ